METICFFMGILGVTAIVVLAKLNRPALRPWYVNLPALAGALLLVFTFGWCANSMVEGECWAAQVGLMIFGLPTVALFMVAGILLIRQQRKS